MKELKLGSKVALLDKYNGHIKELYHVIRINKYTYTLNNSSLIDKETLREKTSWLERQYVMPSDEMIETFIEVEAKRIKRQSLLEFNKEALASKEVLEFYLQHKDDLELNDDVIDNINYIIEVLAEDLKGYKEKEND